MPFTYDQYDQRPWYRKFSERWATALGYVALALAMSLGVWGYSLVTTRADSAQQQDIDRNQATILVLCAEIDQVVDGLKGFVDGLLQAGSEREAVLQQLEANLPDGAACAGVTSADP